MPDKPTPAPLPAAAIPLKALAEEKAGALHPEDSVEAAGILMREHETGKWPVAEDRKLVGMIHRENPDWQIGGHGHDPKDWKVSQIMSRSLVFCYEDEDCETAQKVMEERGLGYLPVVDREMRIIGIFSHAEILAKAKVAAAAQAESGKVDC